MSPPQSAAEPSLQPVTQMGAIAAHVVRLETGKVVERPLLEAQDATRGLGHEARFVTERQSLLHLHNWAASQQRNLNIYATLRR
ncbi:hypothetical protein A5678_25015 [Mycobacterium sp. E2733]|nr:hypothetical protein A5678_25015 [Mycobacterium sp. E2733]